MKDFEVIYRQYYQEIFRFLMRLTGNNYHLSEELAQESFYQAYISLGRFKSKCSIKTWLCKISKNCWMKYIRKNKKISIGLDCWEDLLAIPRDEIPDHILERKEKEIAVRTAIQTLNEKQRSVVVLRAYYDMSFFEIEQVTGITDGTAKVIYQRAKNIIRKNLYKNYK